VVRTATVARADLVRRIRNRSAIVTAFVAPLLLATLLGWILDGDRTFTVAVVDADRSPTSQAIVDALLGGDTGDADGAAVELTVPANVRFRTVTSERQARSQVTGGDASAAIVIPAGYGSPGGDRAPALVVLRSPRRLVGGQVAEAVATAISDRVQRAELARATASRRGVDRPGGSDRVAAAAASAPTPLPISDGPSPGATSPVAYFGASMCIVFLFFTVGFAPRSVMLDRESGMLDRVLSTGTSLAAVIAGKGLVAGLLGGAGFVGVWVVTSVAFGAGWGGSAPVVVLIVATVVAVGGLTVAVASVGATERQADAYATIVTLVLALMGGNFVSLGSAPRSFRRLALLTPNGWALRGFSEVSSGGPLGAAVLPAVVLVVMGGIAGTIGFVRLRRALTR
jgi:ABC-2 type transport system permease protein